MDYSKGKTLEAYVREHGGRISVDDTLLLMRSLFQTLEELHSAGVIYGKIKPDNIIVQQDEEEEG